MISASEFKQPQFFFFFLLIVDKFRGKVWRRHWHFNGTRSLASLEWNCPLQLESMGQGVYRNTLNFLQPSRWLPWKTWIFSLYLKKSTPLRKHVYMESWWWWWWWWLFTTIKHYSTQSTSLASSLSLSLPPYDWIDQSVLQSSFTITRLIYPRLNWRSLKVITSSIQCEAYIGKINVEGRAGWLVGSLAG